MTIAYFDCFSGIAGDMLLGALVDAGMPLSYLVKELKKISLGGYELKKEKHKRPVAGTHVNVLVKKEPSRCSYKDLRDLIIKSRLAKRVRDTADSVFHKLAQAEARVHGVPLERVHFHEVGAVDSIVDVVGSAIGFDYFGFKEIYSSPLPVTRGKIKTAHGILPVPAPVTMEIIKNIPLEKSPVRDEIVTPTGAAIITTVAKHFGECPLQKVGSVGFGYGDKVFAGIPNALRLMIGEGYPVVVIEANVDDMNPQIFGHVMEQLFKAGAVDVLLQPVQMKKNRPGILLQCQAPWDKKEKAINIILKETTSIGVRYYPVERKVLKRELKVVQTRFGKIRVKTAFDDKNEIIKYLPEYEDLRKISKKTHRPLLSVIQEIHFHK
jgi:uncharacterized protein (TIGR00299 family) protein